MEGFKIYNKKSVSGIISTRKGESKFGEKVGFANNLEELSQRKEKYVLFGIPEDIGVRANLGKAGTAKAWNTCLKSLLNIQTNQYTYPQNVILLGEVDCSQFMSKASNIGEEDPNYLIKLGELVSQIDEIVAKVVEEIISAGKIPLIIGGGHNNAYGNIKGASIAVNSPVNVLNIDAHTDLRTPDHRHSGNGFSIARRDKYLNKYRMFGIHQNYTPDYIFKQIDSSTQDEYQLYEHLMLKSSSEINKIFQQELDLVAQGKFGLELDCDAIRNFPSSAKSPGGFSFTSVRRFVSLASKEENILYLHLCEAAPTTSTENKVGKALSYLITDFLNHP